MNDEGSHFIGRLMVPEGTKNPHEENCLRSETSVRLSDCITVETRRPGLMITRVKKRVGDSMCACVDCVMQGGETCAGLEREAHT